MEFGAEVFELFIVKLPPIVYNYDAGQTKSADDRLPDEVFSLCLGDLGH